ncbi:DedA family protein [Arthrobacter pigmenti]
MPDINQILDTVGHHGGLILAVVFIASIVEAAFGLGALLPGETVLVLAAVALAPSPLLMLAVLAAAAGAFIGDHIGFLIGRKLGARMAGTAVVRRIGTDRWDAATEFVKRRGFWLIVIARLLPGVRTLVAAAAGASDMRYRRFALATGTAASIWSVLWVMGGAALGSAFLEFAGKAAVPTLAAVAVIVAGIVAVRRALRSA